MAVWADNTNHIALLLLNTVILYSKQQRAILPQLALQPVELQFWVIKAINAALSADNFESASPDSMKGIRVAAARNRFNSGEDGGKDLGIQKI